MNVITKWAAVPIALAVIGAVGVTACASSGVKNGTRTVAATSAKPVFTCQAGMTPDQYGVCQPSETAAAPSPSDSGPEMLSVNQTEFLADADTGQAEGTITVYSPRVTTSPADDFGEAPANGYFVIVHVTATCDQAYTSGFDINELDFYALAGGRHYSWDSGNASSALSSSQMNQDLTATLAAGESSSGWIAFDVSSPRGEIVYAPNMDGQPLAEWQY